MDVNSEFQELMKVLSPSRGDERTTAQEAVRRELCRTLMYLNDCNLTKALIDSKKVADVISETYSEVIASCTTELVEVLAACIVVDKNLESFGFSNVPKLIATNHFRIFLMTLLAACYFEMISIIDQADKNKSNQ